MPDHCITYAIVNRGSDLSVPLATLSRYENVVWITDAKSAQFAGDGFDLVRPMTSLRYINDLQRPNTLEWYIALGGKVWVVGGGGGVASTIRWNDPGNDAVNLTFAVGTELKPGRFMYDITHWQSEFHVVTVPIAARKYTGRHESGAEAGLPYTAQLGELPPRLERKSARSDVVPPLRSAGEFYPQAATAEFLQGDNNITELMADSTKSATLDTLYEVVGPGLPNGPSDHNVVMTYYHGEKAPQGFLFAGFDLWSFGSGDTRRLVDFVLTKIWNVHRQGTAVSAR